MKRRDCIKIVSSALAVGALSPAISVGEGRHGFTPAALLPPGEDKVPYPSALRSLMVQLTARTSIDADADRVDVHADSAELFRYPFLYLSGRDNYPDFTDSDIKRLRTILEAGGSLFADDASGIPASAFDTWFRRQMDRLYPRNKLELIPEDHTVMRSFYMLDSSRFKSVRIGGRVLVKDSLEGITIGDRSPVIYCQNDAGGAWATDLFGKALNVCEPGGEDQREMAWRLGVNIIMYTLCLNYKKDRVHVEAILERRKLK